MCHVSPLQPRRSLPFNDNLLLWSMRAWVIGRHRDIPVRKALWATLTRLGAPEAIDDLDLFMTTIGAGASRQIQVDCVCQPTVSADERLLLDVVALCQQRRSFESVVLLRGLMAGDDALAVCGAAGRLADSLRRAGCMLTHAQQETDRHVFGDTPSATRATLH